jgi:hypothetical protein
MTTPELVDISAILKHETERAYLINDGGEDVWVPKSQVEKYAATNNGPSVFIFTMPRWLAHDKGLI